MSAPNRRSRNIGFLLEEQIAAKVKCPLHGERFKQLQFRIYVAKWLREKLWKLMWIRRSEQYRKAWFAAFPQELWPAEEDMSDGPLCLKLKDGSRLSMHELSEEAH